MGDEDDDFAALFEASAASKDRHGRGGLKAGQAVEGVVVAITGDTVFVDIGARTEARIERSFLLSDSGELSVAVGDRLKATVSDPGGGGPPILKLGPGRGGATDAAELELAAKSGTPVEGEFTRAVKAGLEVDIGGVRAFCPASQVDLAYTADLEALVGQQHFFKVLEVKNSGRSIVVSRRAILEEERSRQAQELAARLELGSDLDGIVQSLQPYGVFVDLGGLQGLVHISELSHTRVSSPSDVVSVGEKVRVKVLSIEPAASGKDMRISLSMKALNQPVAVDRVKTTEVLTATVTKVEGYGLLVDTPEGAGLVPTIELALPPGSDPRRAYNVGDNVPVVLLRREQTGKLRLSAKAVEDAQARRDYAAFRQKSGGRTGQGLGSLGDLLKAKLKK